MSSPESDENDRTKCIRCDKVFCNQNCVACDECGGWLHIKCAGLKLKEFLKIDANTPFSCRYCLYYKCGKCSLPVYPTQNGIKCDIDGCEKWFHLNCTKFTLAEYKNQKSRLHTEPWYCPDCTKLPFANLSDNDFKKIASPEINLRDFIKNTPGISSFCTRCSVCSRKITKNQAPKSLPCKSLVHRKCSNISLSSLLSCKPSNLKHWSCNQCRAFSFPFQDMSIPDLLKLTYNSLFFLPLFGTVSGYTIRCL